MTPFLLACEAGKVDIVKALHQQYEEVILFEKDDVSDHCLCICMYIDHYSNIEAAMHRLHLNHFHFNFWYVYVYTYICTPMCGHFQSATKSPTGVH